MSEKPVAFIYCIRNTVNGRLYIGATVKSLERRLDQHFSRFKTFKFQRRFSDMKHDYDKFGKSAFTIELVENVYDINLVEEIEDYWITEVKKKYGNLVYNRNKSNFSVTVKQIKIKVNGT